MTNTERVKNERKESGAITEFNWMQEAVCVLCPLSFHSEGRDIMKIFRQIIVAPGLVQVGVDILPQSNPVLVSLSKEFGQKIERHTLID